MSHRALGQQFDEVRGHPMVDPKTWPVWQALDPGALPPGVKHWTSLARPGADPWELDLMAARHPQGVRDLLPEIHYPEWNLNNHDRHADDEVSEWRKGNLNTVVPFNGP